MACLNGSDFGAGGFEIDKPAFKDGLGDVFEGLIGLAVDFGREREQRMWGSARIGSLTGLFAASGPFSDAT